MSRLDQLSTRLPFEKPAIAVLQHAQKHKVSRAPMVNPYDKFTQPEFDAWIGDITGAIRHALGYEQEAPRLLGKIHVNSSSPNYGQLDLSDQDEIPDDSFAHIKTRRDKGKARDPREGPGLGRNHTQPIEIVSSDEEEEGEVESLALSIGDDDHEYDQDEDAYSDYLWERSSPSYHTLSSPPARIGPPSRLRQNGVVENSNEGSEDDDNDEYEDHNEDFVKHVNATSEVITISDEDESVDEDDEEDENHQEFNYHDRPRLSSFRYPRDVSFEEEQQGVDEIQPLDHDTSFPPLRSSPHRNVELNDPWEAPRIYAEDFYSGGELRLSAQVHPDHLGSFDEDVETVEEDEENELYERDGEISSKLRPSSKTYQDSHFKGSILTSLHPQFDTHFAARAEDEDSGIESFLTPGVLTPNQSELRSHLDETEDAVESGFTHERAQSPSHPILPPVIPSRQNNPIPQDADIIVLDDSDNDEDEDEGEGEEAEEDGLQVIPPPDAILEMVTESVTMHPEEPEVEEYQTNFPVENIDKIGDDEVLSVHTAYTEDIGLENRLHPYEIVEPEAGDSTEVNKAKAFDVVDKVGDDEVLSVHTAYTELENRLQPYEIVEPEAEDSNEGNLAKACDVVNIDKDGDDDVLSVHTAYTEDIGLGNRTQAFEIVEPEAVDSTEENKAKAFDVGLIPEVAELELEVSPGDLESEVALPIQVENSLPLDAGPKSLTMEMDEQALDYYGDFDDIYETPVPEALPSNGGPIDPAEPLTVSGSQTSGHEKAPHDMTSQGIEVEETQDGSSAAFPAGNARTEVNDNAEVSSMGDQPPRWLENISIVFDDIAPESAIETASLATSSNRVIGVDATTLYGSATSDGLRNAVSVWGHSEADKLDPKTPDFTPQNLPVVASPSRTSSLPGQSQIPMPVMADENVPDPTESPTRIQEHPILSIPGTPNIVVTSLQPLPVPEFPVLPPESLFYLHSNADGLFTPAEFSTVTTPAEDLAALIVSSEWQEADVWSSQTVAPVDLDARADLADEPAVQLPAGVVDSLTETDTVPSASKELSISVPRKSVLMPDPYPYCLSTPISPAPDEGSSEENDDDNSICSHSTAEKEKEKVEMQCEFPLAADIVPPIRSPPATTELESTSAARTETSDALQAMAPITQNLPESTTVEQLGILPTTETDTLVAMEPEYPFQPTMRLEDSSNSVAETSVEGPKEQVSAAAQQPLELSAHADLQSAKESPEVNLQTPNEEKEASDSAIPNSSHLPHTNEQLKEEASEAISSAPRPSKRKRDTSPDLDDGSDGLSVNGKGKLRASRNGKRRGKVTEESVHDRHVRPRLSPKHHERKSATSALSENSGQPQTPLDGVASHPIDNPSQSEVTRPRRTQLHFHAPSLLHAHGRAKRQKLHIQPFPNLKLKRDHEGQSVHQPATQHKPVLEKLPLQSGPLHDPSPLADSVLPTTTEAVVSEAQETAQSDALSSIEPSQPNSATVVSAVDLPTQETAMTIPQPSSTATAGEMLQSAPTAAFHLPSASHSSPARLLTSSISPSPVRSTRSQCKYHKITLPKGEDGPHICFLVPGCSLTNQELMEEEEIRDLGEATYEDSLRIIRDIEDLDFDQYLIGTLRQLVGLDILREGEVFYLPQPGVEVHRKHWPRKSISERPSTAKGSDFASFAGSPGYSYSGSARSPSTRPPLSNAGSMPTSTTDYESDMGDKQEPSAVTLGDRILPEGRRKSSTWKGKFKDNDVTFQPEDHDEESADEESTRKRRRKSTKRGVKRTRTHDGATGNDGARRSKRLKLQLTDPSLYQSQQHD